MLRKVFLIFLLVVFVIPTLTSVASEDSTNEAIRAVETFNEEYQQDGNLIEVAEVLSLELKGGLPSEVWAKEEADKLADFDYNRNGEIVEHKIDQEGEEGKVYVDSKITTTENGRVKKVKLEEVHTLEFIDNEWKIIWMGIEDYKIIE